MISITESPRDAMQGLKKIIPAEIKAAYINKLFQVGFDTIDIGSLVSAKAIPQMSDTEEVIQLTDAGLSQTKISLLVGNSHYALKAAQIDSVDYINYPFSISETFLQKNLKSDFEKSYKEIDAIIDIAKSSGKQAVITVSSAFGNPYGDLWSIEILSEHISNLLQRGLQYIPIADTTSEADAERMHQVFNQIKRAFPQIEFNVHLHTYPHQMTEKVQALYDAGCRSFDTVFNGLGGCPMSGKQLIGNLNTMDFIRWLDEHHIPHKLNRDALVEAAAAAKTIFD
jgi:hydroxymethylglutaryl-CoA lyase